MTATSSQVLTRSGHVEGELRPGHIAFRGIPYARPPVGALRFRAPEPAESWSGVRPAVTYGSASVQGGSGVTWMEAEGGCAEDCLYLNVYTRRCEGKKPVLVWVHGGAFILGSSSSPLYDGGPLCERGDVVVVTFNYRLGGLGFLYLGEHGGDRIGASANLGSLDQIAALRWVQANIEAFGGDPDNVTLFGESAGGISVSTLLLMPQAQGLFHRAIAQSGSAYQLLPAEHAARVADRFLHAAGVSRGGLERLRELDVSQLLAAQNAAAAPEIGLAYTPVADGRTLPASVRQLLAAGSHAKVPLLIGTNRDEMNLFRATEVRQLDEPMDRTDALAVLVKMLGPHAPERLPELFELYRASRERRGLPSSNRALIGALLSDERFRLPAIHFAEDYGVHEPRTYMYLFTYESPAMHGALRACHALELAFVFGTLHAPLQDRFAGSGPAVTALSETMMDVWLAFARSGDPSTDRTAPWPPYEPQRRTTLLFDLKLRFEDAPFEEERAAWPDLRD